MLLGRTGAGKTSAVNTILPHVTPEVLRRSVRWSGERKFPYRCYNISIVDTPDWLSPVMSDDDVIADIVHCCSLSAPGPHAFLLVVPLTEPSQEDHRWIKLIQEIFGTGALNYIMILFTHNDGVSDSIDQLIAKGNEVLEDLVVTCGNRYHKFNNEISNSDAQVKTMLYKVLNMVRGNGSTFYCGHSRASVFLSNMVEETRRGAVETMRRGQEGCRSRGGQCFLSTVFVHTKNGP